MQTIADFFSHPIFIIVGGLLLLWSFFTFVFVLYSFAQGIAPVLWRLGRGLSNRKIAVFAEDDFEDLNAVLLDSRLFQKSNIIRIGTNSLKKAETCTVFLMHWGPFAGKIEQILEMKLDTTALIVYARPREIPDDQMEKINQHRNVTVVNFRGRLMSDILVSMITTGYKLK